MNVPPLVARVMAWMDLWYQPSDDLLAYPSDEGSATNPYQQPGVPVVRESAVYGVGLLARDGAGDRDRAADVIERVLDHQIDEPASVCHGTFLRSPVEPRPGSEPREWIDYDPNWREFVGCSLALALDRFGDRLPTGLVARMEGALRLAAEGSVARAVSARYSNVALMSAFLLDWVGNRLGVAGFRTAGLKLAHEIAREYRRCGAFEEHNSPTYYGVDLYGLALWRSVAVSPVMGRLGRELEAGLWRDLARFYHAGLRNLCGPYTRAYGMDMTRYVAALGAWILPAVPGAAPLPPLGRGVSHGHDFYELLWVGLLGASPPDDVRPHLTGFRGERRVEQLISLEPRRVATAWLAEHLMLGGEHSSGRSIHWQHHPATLHWRLPDGDVGWLRLVTNAPADAVASRGRLEIEVHTGLGWLREAEVYVWLEVSRDPGDGAGSFWRLPGLDLSLRAEPSAVAMRIPGGTDPSRPSRLGWTFAPGQAPRTLGLQLDVAPAERA